MPQNGIVAKGVVELAKAIRFNPSLKRLCLGDNTFGEDGAIAMANALEGLTQLEVIDFSDCLCRNRGSMKIAQSLVASKTPLKVKCKNWFNIYFRICRNWTCPGMRSTPKQPSRLSQLFVEAICRHSRSAWTASAPNLTTLSILLSPLDLLIPALKGE